MANQLKMAILESILHLHALGWSQRQIAREEGIDRGTVRKHLIRCQNAAKAAILPAGSAGSKHIGFFPTSAPFERSLVVRSARRGGGWKESG
jgi:hypothetical protein